MKDEPWTPQFVLPNLSVLKPIGTDNLAVVAANDPRVEAFAEKRPEFATFVNRFTDAFRVRANVAILLRRDDAPATYHTIEAAAAFRNIVALAIVPYGRAILALSPHHQGIFWGDTFAFHPWMLSRDPDTIFCRSPAMWGIHGVTEFHGQSSPAVPLLTADRGNIDQPLLDALLRHWSVAYGKGTMEHDEIKLFRSLNMAYNACLIPAASRETLVFDVGRLLSLWVSAFEILAHPGPSGKATRDGVLDVLDQQPVWVWNEVRDLAIPIAAARAKKTDAPVLRKLPSWFYVRLYDARNDFLHGNPVTATSHLIEPDGAKSLLDVAAPLYRFALASALGLAAPPSPVGSGFDTPQYAEAIVKRSIFVNYNKTYEDMLLHALSAGTYKTFFGVDRPVAKSH